MPVIHVGSTLYKPATEFDRLDRLHDIGYQIGSAADCDQAAALKALRVDGLPVAYRPDLERWAVELGQRAGSYRESESPRL